MAKLYGWAKEFHEKFKDDPEFITTGIVLEIVDNLAGLMEEKGISRAELARRLGKSRGYITKLLRGYYNNLTIKTLVELALAIEENIENFSDLARIFSDTNYNWDVIYSLSKEIADLSNYWSQILGLETVICSTDKEGYREEVTIKAEGEYTYEEAA